MLFTRQLIKELKVGETAVSRGTGIKLHMKSDGSIEYLKGRNEFFSLNFIEYVTTQWAVGKAVGFYEAMEWLESGGMVYFFTDEGYIRFSNRACVPMFSQSEFRDIALHQFVRGDFLLVTDEMDYLKNMREVEEEIFICTNFNWQRHFPTISNDEFNKKVNTLKWTSNE